jgi:adenylate cyclase, class 2
LTETEIKLRAESPEAARQALTAIGAVLESVRHLEDNLVFDDDRSSLRERGGLLRLRETPHENVLTYKGPANTSDGVRHRTELEVIVSDAGITRRMLEGLGFRVRFRYQKYREAYAWKDLEIVVDETPFGTFFELEGEPRSIHDAAAALGYGRDDYITDSYAALFFASGGVGDMVFR